MTGHDLDSRSAVFGKGQLLWTPTARWEARAHRHRRARARRRLRAERSGERCAPTRSTSSRDFEGFTAPRHPGARPFRSPTPGRRVDFSTTTGFVRWKTDDLDRPRLHAAAAHHARQRRGGLPVHRRRCASRRRRRARRALRSRDAEVAGGPVPLHAELQAGRRQQLLAVRAVAVPRLSGRASIRRSRRSTIAASASTARRPFTFASSSTSPSACAPTTRTRRRTLNTFFSPAIAPPTAVTRRARTSPTCRRSSRSPTACAPERHGLRHGRRAASRPAASTPRRRRAARPTARSTAGTTKAASRPRGPATGCRSTPRPSPSTGADLQVNVPNPLVPGQFYIANAGGRDEHGRRVRAARPAGRRPRCVRRRSATRTRASAAAASSGGVDVSGNTLPNTPDYTGDFGVQYRATVCAARPSLTARAEVVVLRRLPVRRCEHGGQDAYSLANFARRRARQARCSPKCGCATPSTPATSRSRFAYPGLAPSGFIGEAARRGRSACARA